MDETTAAIFDALARSVSAKRISHFAIERLAIDLLETAASALDGYQLFRLGNRLALLGAEGRDV